MFGRILFLLVVCFILMNHRPIYALDTLKLRKNYLLVNVDLLNSGNYFLIGGGIGLSYYRYLNRHVDMGTELGCSFGPSYFSEGDVASLAVAFKYKLLAEYKPVKGPKHIFKLGFGFAGANIRGNIFGICNKFTYQVNRRKKGVVGLYVYNDLYFNRSLDGPLDIFGFGFFFGGRF